MRNTVVNREVDWEVREKAVKILTGLEEGEVTDIGRIPFPGAKMW